MKPMKGRSVRFTIKGWDGRPHFGKGIITELAPTCAIVRLKTDDLGGFGTYRRGQEVRITYGEINEQEHEEGNKRQHLR